MKRNGFYNIVGSLARLSIAFLSIPLLIRWIGVEEYGLWVLASTALGMVGIAEGGLSTSTTFFISRDIAAKNDLGLSETLSTVMTAMLLLATTASAGLSITAPSLVSLFSNLQPDQQSTVEIALQLGSLLVWTRLMQGIAIGVEQANECYGAMNILLTLQSLLANLGMLVIAGLGGKTLAFMGWQVGVSCLSLGIHTYVSWSLLKEHQVRFRWSRDKSRKIAQYSAATWFTSLGSALFQNGDRLIVGSLLGPKALGVYAAIVSVTSQINNISSSAIQPLLPRLRHLIEKQLSSENEIKKIIRQSLQVNVLIILVIESFLILFAPTVVNLLFGMSTIDNYLPIFCIATIIYSLYSANAAGHYMLLAAGATNVLMITTVLSGAVSLILIYGGAVLFGLSGAVIGNVGYVGTYLLTLWGMRKFKVPLQEWLRWMKFPFVYLLIFYLGYYVLDFSSQSILIRAMIFSFQLGALLFWFLRNQEFKVNKVLLALLPK
jgi:O-antigen/teichoic acid export membrane protein